MSRSAGPDPWPTGPVRTSTGTAEIRVVAPRQAILVLDGMESSFHDLDDATHLEFEYIQHVDAAVATRFDEVTPVRALHLGAGGCSLARAWDATRPGSTQLAVEWDAELARLVREWFPLPRAPRLRIRTGDARAALEAFPAGRWDVIVRDVFVEGAVPAHLAEIECARAARRALDPDGLYLANMADGAPLAHARAEVATFMRVFESVALVVDPAVVRGRRYGNLVLAGSRVPIDEAALARRARSLPIPVRVMAGSELNRFAAASPSPASNRAMGPGGPWRA